MSKQNKLFVFTLALSIVGFILNALAWLVSGPQLNTIFMVSGAAVLFAAFILFIKALNSA